VDVAVVSEDGVVRVEGEEELEDGETGKHEGEENL
jgi:hypothetical protein